MRAIWLISRDIRDVDYHASFVDFMNTIREHDFVVVLVSDYYLKSRNCMYEMVEALKDSRYKDKIVYIVISEEDRAAYDKSNMETGGPNILNIDSEAYYIKYWEEQSGKIQSQIDEIADITHATNYVEEKKHIQRILLDLPDFLKFIREHNSLTLKTHKSEAYSRMLGYLGIK